KTICAMVWHWSKSRSYKRTSAMRLPKISSCGSRKIFFFQAEDGIRDYKVTGFRRVLFRSILTQFMGTGHAVDALHYVVTVRPDRSEERRVGKECRSRWWAYRLKKKN